MQQANDYHQVGDLLQIRDKHLVCLYKNSDPYRRFYEDRYLDAPAVMLVLGSVVEEGSEEGSKSSFRSYLVLTYCGTYHIQAWTRNHQYSYYDSI